MIRATILSVLLLLIASFPALASEGLVPAEIGGAPAQVSTASGLELVAGLDPADERDLERIDRLETLLAVTDRPIGALSVMSAYPADGVAGGWVVALKVAGSEGAVLRALLLAGIRQDLGSPREEDVVLAGKPLTLIGGDEASGEPPLVLYGQGDTAWLLGGSEDEVTAILEQLP